MKPTRYALITTDGELDIRTGDWTVELGPEGSSRVRLHPGAPISGWVNEVGLLMPEKYPRNVIGSLMLCTLGGPLQPYAGPVVITGMQMCPHHGPEQTDLSEAFADYLGRLRRDVERALDGEPIDIPDGAEWADSIRQLADLARNGEAPPIQIITLGFGGLN